VAIRVGIGGWDYDPWRGTFYPEGLAKARQLHFASRQVSAIEVNATFYKLQTPATFERWAAETPDDFNFAIKGSRFCTNRKVLADAGEAVTRFCGQGFTRLGSKLGPILWQFAETKTLDPDDIAAFFQLLPREQDGLALRHAVEARHPSFADLRFREAADRAGIAICFHDGAGGEEGLGAAPGGFGYARLVRCREDEPAGYSSAELDRLAAAARAAAGDMFLFFINGAKVRAPAAATALLGRLGAKAKS
jgi:uncharacterized protein YecE (DUF72 family)